MASEVSFTTKEIRDLTRMERIGAHSHIRGASINYRYLNVSVIFHTLI